VHTIRIIVGRACTTVDTQPPCHNKYAHRVPILAYSLKEEKKKKRKKEKLIMTHLDLALAKRGAEMT
jgi:hypothetical protein